MSAAASQSQRFGRRNEVWLWLIIITVLAIAVRFNGLTFQSYWFDELFSAHFSRPAHSFWQVVNLTLGDVHPPLYQITMWGSYKLFGHNELAGRLPSFLAGIITVPVIYLLGRDLISKRVGLYAAALAIPNYYLVYYAQEARSYAFLYCLCSLSFLFFMRALRSESKLNVALYVCSTIALLYTHYFVFVALAAQGLILLAFMAYEHSIDRKLMARAGIALGIILLSAAPLIPSIAGHSDINNFWIQQPDSWFFVDYFVRYFNSVFLASVFGLLLLAGVIISLLPINSAPNRFAVMALLIWVLIGYLLPWLRGVFAQPILTDRNTIMLVPPLLVLISVGLTQLKPVWLQRLAGLLLLSYSLWHLLAVVDYDGKIRKNQYREITAALTAFDQSLPVYTLQYNDTKYNVYFEQEQSGLRAEDHSILAARLAEGTAQSVFWIADGFNRLLQTEIDEQYGLVEVARYRFEGTLAALYVNPAASEKLMLGSDSSDNNTTGNYLSEQFVLAPGNSVLVAFAGGDKDKPGTVRKAVLELVDEQANIIASGAFELGGMDTALQFKPQLAAQQNVKLRVNSTDLSGQPTAWLLKNENSIQN